MTTTSWNRSFKLALAVVLVIAAAVVPAGAVTVADASVVSDAEVGSEVEITVTLTELYQNPSLEEWTLAGSTELQSPTWTVEYIDQTGSKVRQESYGGQTFDNASVAASDGIAEIRVTLSGTVPAVSGYTYDPKASFEAVRLTQVAPGGGETELVSETTTHFTAESQSAREAISGAETAVTDAGEPDEASNTLQQAINAYENENFELATELAGEAKSEAESVQGTQERNELLLIGAGVVVLLALVGGGVWYLRQQNQQPDKLG